ncbi:MAG: flagellar brake protein [Burkholderiaceae bacterium]|jgi:c-di-GMP-binding flagellar brake protein YcgR|nr:flagellar brake protein [Burkholderiales bacterium]MCA3216810.1 flagellar brake protein [Burkholderiales bacterium]MCE2644374.1 flagellar brake protein [Burkholderiaceae bacterium]
MGHTHPFPEPDSPDLEPFMVYSRVEILAMLRQLGERGNLITCYFDQHDGFAVTVLLAVNQEFEEAIFDLPGDTAALQRLLAADELVFVAFVGQIKLQFRARKAETTHHEGKPAIRVRLPREVLRLQRRDSFRVRTPIAKPATCLVPHPVGTTRNDGPRTYEQLKVLDLSVGGVALLTYPERFALTAGQALRDCYLDLPGIGQLAISLTVRHVDVVPDNEHARRCGCELVRLPPQARLMLQRYVNRVEAEQRKVAAPV